MTTGLVPPLPGDDAAPLPFLRSSLGDVDAMLAAGVRADADDESGVAGVGCRGVADAGWLRVAGL